MKNKLRAEALLNYLLVSGTGISNEPNQLRLHFTMDCDPPVWHWIIKPNETEYTILPYLDIAYKTIQQFGMVNGLGYIMDKANYPSMINAISTSIKTVTIGDIYTSLQLSKAKISYAQLQFSNMRNAIENGTSTTVLINICNESINYLDGE